MANKIIPPSINFHFTGSGSFLTNRRQLKSFLINLFSIENKSLASLTYIFCDDEYLLNINKQYLQHDYYTDIITFELSDNAFTEGEIYISIDRVKDNAQSFNTTFQQELHRVIFHGALHLCGYKDKSATQTKLMRSKEQEYLDEYFN